MEKGLILIRVPNHQNHFGAGDRNRTGTGITSHGILSPGRLPVPPLRRMQRLLHSLTIIPHDLWIVKSFFEKTPIFYISPCRSIKTGARSNLLFTSLCVLDYNIHISRHCMPFQQTPAETAAGGRTKIDLRVMSPTVRGNTEIWRENPL